MADAVLADLVDDVDDFVAAARFLGSALLCKGASLAQRAAARLLQSSAAAAARGGEGQREAAAEAAADAARDLVLTRPTPSSVAAAAPAAAAAAKALEEEDDIAWVDDFVFGEESVGRRVGFGGLWLSAAFL